MKTRKRRPWGRRAASLASLRLADDQAAIEREGIEDDVEDLAVAVRERGADADPEALAAVAPSLAKRGRTEAS